QSISLENTNQTSTLSITTKKAASGNGQVDVASLGGTGAKSISAATVNVTGGVNLTGYVGSIVLRDVEENASFVTSGLPTQTTTITVHEIGDGAELDLGTLTNLNAARIGEATISAPAIGKMSIKGDSKSQLAGDLEADITLSGEGVAAGKLALASLSIT